eukprot:g4970.t1
MSISIISFALLVLSELSRTQGTLLQHPLESNVENLRGMPLNVSDCTDFLNDVQCERLGFFITSFYQQAYWSDGNKRSDERVPVNGIKCCRPSLTSSMVGLLPPGVTPVSIMSIGCHISNNEDAFNMGCEQDRLNLVTGFVESFLYPDGTNEMLIPATGVACCIPVLLLSTGDAWELEFCNWETSIDTTQIQCGTDQLLWGFNNAEKVYGHKVPIAPATCSGLCLGNSIHDMSHCEHHRHCNGNGVCIMGECECFADWLGSDCGKLKSEYFSKERFHSSVWYLAGLGFLGAFLCLFVTYCSVRRSERRQQESRQLRTNQGLADLISSYVNGAGSAGTTDTETEEDASPEDDQLAHREEEEEEEEVTDEMFQPLLQMNCCICETRSVQITLVPCGHSNLCRKCSRKLNNCPFCREPIFRRQRLFLST